MGRGPTGQQSLLGSGGDGGGRLVTADGDIIDEPSAVVVIVVIVVDVTSESGEEGAEMQNSCIFGPCEDSMRSNRISRTASSSLTWH